MAAEVHSQPLLSNTGPVDTRKPVNNEFYLIKAYTQGLAVHSASLSYLQWP